MLINHIPLLFAYLFVLTMPGFAMDDDQEHAREDAKPEKKAIFKDVESADSDDDARRLVRARADKGRPPGPPTRFYQYFWGHYGEMRAKGILPFIEEVAEKYGKDGVPVHVSLGMKDLYVISDPNDAQLILSGPNKHQFVKGFSSQFLRDYFVGEGVGFLETNGEGWRELHDALFRFFKEAAVRDRYFAAMKKHAQDLVTHLEGRAGTVIDLEQEMIKYTLKIISSTMLNVEINDDEMLTELVQSFATVMKFIHYRMTNFPFYLPLFLPTTANQNFKSAVRVVDAFIEKALAHDEKLARKGQPSDSLISYLRAATQSAQPIDPMQENSGTLQISRARMLGNIRNILMAGHDTTKHALTSLYYHLTQNPKVKKHLHKELTKMIAKKDGLTNVKQLSKANLPFLDAVVQEALRLSSPVPGVARDVLDNVDVRGYLIPKGSVVLISFDLLHRNPNQWKSPLVFDPERFLREPLSDRGEKIKRHHNSLMPFNTGQRACLGRFFAIQEIKTTIIELMLAGIDFDVVKETNCIPSMACTRRLKEGFKVRVIDSHEEI